MPNGHGAVLRFSTPTFFLVLIIATLLASSALGAAWLIYLAYVLALPFSWHLSAHIFKWSVMEYGGATSSEGEKEQARRNHILGTVVFCVVSLLVIRMVT